MRLSVAFVLFVATPLAAQINLVSNSGFEANSLAPWRVTSGTAPSIVNQDRVGFANDRAAQFALRARASTTLVQSITLKRSGWHCFAFRARRLAGRGTVTLSVGTGASWTFGAGGANHTIATKAVRLSRGTKRLVLHVAASSSGLRVQLDDIVVRSVDTPILSFDNTNVKLFAEADRHMVVGFATLQRRSTPLPTPGFRGSFWLDPFRAGGLLFLGVGVSRANTPVPLVRLPRGVNGIGRTVYIQAIDVTGRVIGSRLAIRWRP